jgi:hypothetical protein
VKKTQWTEGEKEWKKGGSEPKAACGKNKKEQGQSDFLGQKFWADSKKSIQARDNPDFFEFFFGQLTAYSGSPQAEMYLAILQNNNMELATWKCRPDLFDLRNWALSTSEFGKLELGKRRSELDKIPPTFGICIVHLLFVRRSK